MDSILSPLYYAVSFVIKAIHTLLSPIFGARRKSAEVRPRDPTLPIIGIFSRSLSGALCVLYHHLLKLGGVVAQGDASRDSACDRRGGFFSGWKSDDSSAIDAPP